MTTTPQTSGWQPPQQGYGWQYAYLFFRNWDELMDMPHWQLIIGFGLILFYFVMMVGNLKRIRLQLYESLLSLAIFAVLILVRRRRAFTGQVVLLYLVLYSAARFTLEFWRDDPRGNVLGLTAMTGLSTSQLISLA